jgi:hypothetical protein
MINIREKLGDFLLTIVSLIIGGVLFAAIMSDNDYSIALYISSSIVVVCLMSLAFLSFYRNNQNLTK